MSFEIAEYVCARYVGQLDDKILTGLHTSGGRLQLEWNEKLSWKFVLLKVRIWSSLLTFLPSCNGQGKGIYLSQYSSEVLLSFCV